MGTVGIDLDNNRVTTYDAQDAATKTQALQRSGKAYMNA